MRTLLSILLKYGLVPAVLLAVSATLLAASNQEEPTEEVRKSEPVGANQLILRAVYQEPSRAIASTAWAPVASARISGPAVIDFEIRDNRELGYLLRHSLSCSVVDSACQFTWKPATLDSLRLGPKNLWVLARQKSNPIQFRYVPVCLCSSSNAEPFAPIHLVLVPTRSINLSYVIKTEGGETIQSESLENLPAGRPFEISITSAKVKPPTVLKVRLNHVAIQEGEVERLTDNFNILWAR